MLTVRRPLGRPFARTSAWLKWRRCLREVPQARLGGSRPSGRQLSRRRPVRTDNHLRSEVAEATATGEEIIYMR